VAGAEVVVVVAGVEAGVATGASAITFHEVEIVMFPPVRRDPVTMKVCCPTARPWRSKGLEHPFIDPKSREHRTLVTFAAVQAIRAEVELVLDGGVEVKLSVAALVLVTRLPS
jgi:hypothetical protein